MSELMHITSHLLSKRTYIAHSKKIHHDGRVKDQRHISYS